MQPLSLMLKGFRGIRDGLGLDVLTLDFERLADGAQLVAIAGANGRGKSTIMDCMHPYLTMPSRAALAGPGGFSYYDHVFLAENVKDLTWAHAGQCYRSQLVIRLVGRRRTEAFLHGLDDAGRWQPVRLEDGTVSDGKVETYARCVEGICGSEDTFFTSVFSAQGKRQLNTYRNAEIKTLLGDLLGQEEIRALGLKAADVARHLKAGLTTVRQELAALELQGERLSAERQRLDGAAGRLTHALAMRQEAQRALDAAQALHAKLTAEREHSRATDAHRARLANERRAAVAAADQARSALEAQDRGENQRLERLDQRIAHRVRQARVRRQTLEAAKRRSLEVLVSADAVRHAGRRLPLAERVLAMRSERTAARRQQAQQLTRCEGTEGLAEHRVSGIERDATQAASNAGALAARIALTTEVPCAGTDLQGRCRLLGDAHEAQALLPSAHARIVLLRHQQAQARRELADVRQQREAVAGAPLALALAERREAIARQRVGRLAVLRAQAGACTQAQAALADVERELALLGRGNAAAESVDTAEEQAERQQIAEAREMIARERLRLAQQASAALARLDDALAALPAPYDEQRLSAAAHALAHARAGLAGAEQSHLAAVRATQDLDALSRQSAAWVARREEADARRIRVEEEIGHWNLLARCMSNDGLIALAIDEAGPTLSVLANELLLACYGPRFTVSIHTLLETGKGEQKEGFDIVVHDGQTGQSKSVGLMSGGERTWVEASLTRAIALYLAQHTGRRYTTLFSDEADGALDPERKRMFMAMKREVLRLGGYEREFFVSQTPELTAVADAVIDLDTMVAAVCPG